MLPHCNLEDDAKYALKLAKEETGRREIVSGNTLE